ncbi:MAG: molybdopterin oxidoreductase [Planctomycetaceae bacterium]|nr:molybdopterin oxidoreductase [Planctomycetaceae bacterium]
MSATDTPLLPILGQDGTADRPTTGCVDRNKQASLLDALLFEQQQPTALDRFGRLLETGALPVQARYYQSLIPATAPEAGEQYAFEVDLDVCSGCKSCVAACHMLNGLDEQESWRDVGLLHGGTSELPVLQHVTSACHHCLDPACMSGCPVGAYEKDDSTGIVKHLDDQCIGCQYCILACPYDVPKYNKDKGIVRKCDMCSDRIAVGEAPACVQSCPHEAISITFVNKQQVVENSETNLFLPGAPEPGHTLPTTNYRTSRVLPRNLLPADYYAVRREHAHWALILTLVLTQLSVGAFLVQHTLDAFLPEALVAATRPLHSISALLLGLLALAASTFHLGRPRYAYRTVIGLRTSWLSREIVAFGLFALSATCYAGSIWLPGQEDPRLGSIQNALGVSVVVCGLVGLLCSIMLYQATRRVLWSGSSTSIRFLSTTLLLGAATVLLTSVLAALPSAAHAAWEIVARYGERLCYAVMCVTSGKLLFEGSLLVHLRRRQTTPLKRSAMLMVGRLARPTLLRFLLGALGGLVIPGLLIVSQAFRTEIASNSVMLCVAVSVLFAASLAGEILERYLFFTAVVAPKMPGGLRP